MFEAFFMLLMQHKFVKSVENIQYSIFNIQYSIFNIQYSIFSFPNDMNYSECRPGR